MNESLRRNWSCEQLEEEQPRQMEEVAGKTLMHGLGWPGNTPGLMQGLGMFEDQSENRVAAACGVSKGDCCVG